MLTLYRLIAGVILLVSTAALPGQSPTIKLEVPTVVVDVIVTDKKGHHVSGLTKDQFKVLEDDTPQEIVSFTSPEQTPPASFPKQPAPSQQPQDTPDSKSPEPSRRPQDITIVMDLGDLQFANLQNACKAAAQYVEQMLTAGNHVSLYWVDSSLHLAAPFTNDRQRLLTAIQRLREHVPSGRFTARDRVQTQAQIDDLFTSIHPEVERGGAPIARQLKPLDPTALAQEREMNILRSWLVIQNTFQARAVFVALRSLAVAYRSLPGRKSIVVFSEGFLHAADVTAELEAVIDASNRANVAFYVIDPLGANLMISSEVRAPDIGGRRSSPNMLAAKSKYSSMRAVIACATARATGASLRDKT